jgi:hypothetical protein
VAAPLRAPLPPAAALAAVALVDSARAEAASAPVASIPIATTFLRSFEGQGMGEQREGQWWWCPLDRHRPPARRCRASLSPAAPTASVLAPSWH